MAELETPVQLVRVAACAGNSSRKPEVTREESHSWAGGEAEQAGARQPPPPPPPAASLLDSCAQPVLWPVWPVCSNLQSTRLLPLTILQQA